MFSGIVQGLGTVREVSAEGRGMRLAIGTAGVDLGEIAPGDSIAVNGVCLTAAASEPQRFWADVSAETLACSTLGTLTAGRSVNLEGSLKLGDSIAGHWVYGHVDGVGRVAELTEEPGSPGSVTLAIEAPAALMRYLAVKGSVAVDGVSLTVNAVTRDRFSVNIIPHTREITVISEYALGTPVNIEVDMIARYLERLIGADSASLSLKTLKEHGFA